MLDEISQQPSVADLGTQIGESSKASQDEESIRITKAELKALVNQAVSEALNDGESCEEEVSNESLLDVTVSTSAAISEALATTIQKRLTEKMSCEVLAKKKEIYKTVPDNMSASLTPTRVNPELWSAIPSHAKTKDKR